MSRPGRLLFIGFLVRGADGESIFEGESHPQYSALRFQQNLLNALEHAGTTIQALTTPPIAAFPRNRHAWVPGVEYRLPGLAAQARQIAMPNLAGIRLFARVLQFVRHGRAALRVPAGGILVYSVHTPMVAAALLLKRLRGTPVFVVIPDLPTFMGGPTHAVKRFLKRVDAVLVRRLLAGADGTFPITENIGRDWLVPGSRYLPMEGISDEAAAALRAAGTNRSYVYRGTGRPVLLYTGALEYVRAFAEAFHRSGVDASLVFVGGGEDGERLQSLAAVDPRIEVKPFMTGDAFAREVDRADFLLNPRDPSWPGTPYSFPSKLLEYLTTGKPIISTRLPGIPDEYFGVFRQVDLGDQPSFETSLSRALAADQDPEGVWRRAEQLAGRLSSASVGAKIVQHMRTWTEKAPR
ncbi:MAG TPA: glycosyltransferase [Vicinamibacterales bacterium]|nr:glycosyltransferase [Vicinamibacterales bacterium]